MTHTHYTVISRDERGLIERRSGKRALGVRGIAGAGAGARIEARVISVEEEAIRGWGTATAIGLVDVLVCGVADGGPRLCLLS